MKDGVALGFRQESNITCLCGSVLRTDGRMSSDELTRGRTLIIFKPSDRLVILQVCVCIPLAHAVYLALFRTQWD